MKDDTRSWLAYARENLAAAAILQDQGLHITPACRIYNRVLRNH
ncbi:hypothetical protein BMS3Bbin14_01451 [bacterium BMS3Bbin14]|nr:hypothetical protein BMS3Abin13_00675 [bacterium BMS3Abin13]GBE52971.1 hypothetical protein BMS3Bbin14_01451 [bacterium BMS3Bbin14]